MAYLHNTHARLVRLRRDDLPGSEMDVEDLRPGLHGLRYVQVHLVPVEVGVVGRGVAQVHAEGGPREDLHLVAHHTHLVEGGLTVEHNKVAVSDVTLNLKGREIFAFQIAVLEFGHTEKAGPAATGQTKR